MVKKGKRLTTRALHMRMDTLVAEGLSPEAAADRLLKEWRRFSPEAQREFFLEGVKQMAVRVRDRMRAEGIDARAATEAEMTAAGRSQDLVVVAMVALLAEEEA